MTQDDFPLSRRWRAKWIWAPGDGRLKNVFYYFRRPFTRSDGEPLTLYIAADTRYQLYVNGHFVGRGAPQSQPFFQYYDPHNLSGVLVAGANCLGVIVNHVGNHADTRGGLLVELTDESGGFVLGTDEAWRVARARAWQENTHYVRSNKATPYQEFYDARKAPGEWGRAGFDDSGWRPVAVVSGRLSDRPPAAGPWSRLVPRDIPRMTADPVLAARVESIEECTDIANRPRPEDLSISLSASGRPLEHSRVEDAGNLCRENANTTVQCSTQHLDRVFDGVRDPCIVVDFGTVLSAYPRLELDGVAGGIVDVGYAERLLDGHFNNAIECHFADRYIMTDGPQVWQPFGWKAFRYLKLRFRSCFRPVTIRSAQAVVTTYPYEARGAFHCGDETLNAVFEISRSTLRLCSNEFIMDTPWREQAQWLGDVAAVTLGGIYACFGDTALPGKFLRQAAANPHPTGLLSNVSNTVNHDWLHTIPDYSLWWVMGLWRHYEYTGEERWLHHLYPTAVGIVRAHLNYVNAHGLIEDMPYWVFIDWADVDRRGECTALNAIFYGALEALAAMARFKNDAYILDLAERTMTGIKDHLQERLFDPERGCFADARIDEELSPKTSEHASLAAIRWGLCDDQTAGAIISRFYEEKSIPYTEAQPFFTSVVLKALDRAGRAPLALALIRERWGGRMVDRGATSTFEEWGTNGSWRSGEYHGFLRSLSHAWSACPAEFLIRSLIGLEIIEPGCAKVRLRPHRAPFDYAATFPTPHGPITVRHQNDDFEITVPDGVELVE